MYRYLFRSKCNENDRREKKKLHDEQGGALESSRKTIPASWFHRREGRRVYRATLLYRQKKRRRGGNGCGAYRRSQKYDERTMCSRDNCRENCVMPLFTLGKLTIYDSAITPLIGSSTVFFDRSCPWYDLASKLFPLLQRDSSAKGTLNFLFLRAIVYKYISLFIRAL